MGNTYCEHRQRHHQAVPGQPRSFRGVIYDRHASVIYRYAARRAGDFAADDVTSETFLVAWEQLETYDLDRDDARPWLFGIATNLLRRHNRAEAKMLKTAGKATLREAVADDSDRIAAQLDAVVATGRIAAALQTGVVPADLRAALYKAAALIPGVIVVDTEANLDGKVGTAIGIEHPNKKTRTDIIIDPATGLLIGERVVTLTPGETFPAETATVWTAVQTSVVNSAP